MDDRVTQAPHTDEAAKRKRTAGELAFDLATYGGFSLLGNEIASTTIMDRATDIKSRFHKPYVKTHEFLQKVPLLNKLDYVKSGRSAFILWACIGGFFLVLPVKAMEDNKGKIVRWFDKLLHPNKVTTPEMQERYEDMDSAPKQTWRSLGEGRIVTVAAAQAVDYAAGWVHGPLGRLADKTGILKDYAGFDRMAATVARQTVLGLDKVKPMFGMKVDTTRNNAVRDIIKNVTDIDQRYKIHENEGKLTKWLSVGGSLLTLSASLTVLFYVSSKMFASGQEKKREQKLAEKAAHAKGRIDRPDEANDNLASANENTPDTSKPTTTVVQAESLSRVNDVNLLAERGA